jgi:hypothetical protein
MRFFANYKLSQLRDIEPWFVFGGIGLTGGSVICDAAAIVWANQPFWIFTLILGVVTFFVLIVQQIITGIIDERQMVINNEQAAEVQRLKIRLDDRFLAPEQKESLRNFFREILKVRIMPPPVAVWVWYCFDDEETKNFADEIDVALNDAGCPTVRPMQKILKKHRGIFIYYNGDSAKEWGGIITQSFSKASIQLVEDISTSYPVGFVQPGVFICVGGKKNSA